jgi:WD40 repeat protein
VEPLKRVNALAALKGHTKTVKSVQIHPDGRFAVSGSDDKTVKVWDLRAGTCVGTLEGHTFQVLSLALFPNSTLVASAGIDNARIYDWMLRDVLGGDQERGQHFNDFRRPSVPMVRGSWWARPTARSTSIASPASAMCHPPMQRVGT